MHDNVYKIDSNVRQLQDTPDDIPDAASEAEEAVVVDIAHRAKNVLNTSCGRIDDAAEPSITNSRPVTSRLRCLLGRRH